MEVLTCFFKPKIFSRLFEFRKFRLINFDSRLLEIEDVRKS